MSIAFLLRWMATSPSMTEQIDLGNQETELRVQQSACAIESIGDAMEKTSRSTEAVAASMSDTSRDR